MNIEAINTGAVTPRQNQATEQVDRKREQVKNSLNEAGAAEKSKDIQPEELLQEIKALTENGTYSVRFENDETNTLVVKVVDRETSEVIRQIPPEELMELTKRLQELEGNIVDTVS